ncbi:MAG: carboxypeptidase regulatory-like domain-containing protein [Acidobacteria bacterium]|nr:carboxypeptidase regulatory-like domain-containing protein [Acidobacteriota bacterium]
MSLRSKLAALTLLLPLLLAPLSAAAAAGGELSGTVTDPKGAVVVGATVTVYPEAGGQPVATVKTDAQGQYKIPNLPPGTYTVGVVAEGFGPSMSEKQAVAEGKAARLDFKLEVATVETSVTVSANGVTPNSDPTYTALRKQGGAQDFAGAYAQVSNLVLKRDAAAFTLQSGELYFLPPVEGRVTGAVFVGEGELSLTPPVDWEKRSLAFFTGGSSLNERFTKLTLRFTDKTYQEVKASPQAKFGTNGPQAARAREIYNDNQSLLRKQLRTNMELRTLIDLYTPERPGFFVAFVGGKRFEKLVFQMDPLGIPEVSPEEVLLASYGETDGGYWTAFHLTDEYRAGKGNSDEDHRIFDIKHHEISAAIKGTHLAASDTLTFSPLVGGSRVLPFDLFPSLRVNRVRDEQGRDLHFIQEKKERDGDFALIWPEPLEAGKEYKVTVEYQGGDALIDVGHGNFFLVPRASWYPNNGGTQFGDRAIFDVTVHYPKELTLVGTGAPEGAPAVDGGRAVAKWSSGKIELAVAGFNYGDFKRKDVVDEKTGYQIEFYANEESIGMGGGVGGSMSTAGAWKRILPVTQNAVRIYDSFFGKLPYTRVAMTEQPAPNFGQAWPTLVYMPYTAFQDATQRYMASGSAQYASDSFFKYVGPHEIAHQWWGHLVGWKSYRDQWMSEGFAEFSASLYAQITEGTDKFLEFWEDQRQLITQSRPETRDRKPYTVGPVTQGYRLNNGKTGNVARFMIYPKGAYILHMLRMMMYDRKTVDQRFTETMKDFIQTNYNKDVSTEDFKRAVERHMTPEMSAIGDGKMDWFFDEFVYGTEMPSYRLDYSVGADNVLTGRVTQSGVSDSFRMLVPVYADFGKGWVRLGSAPMRGNSITDLGRIQLPYAPKHVAVAAYKDILALDVENKKQ